MATREGRSMTASRKEEELADLERKSKIIIQWMEEKLKAPMPNPDLREALLDGVVLCKLANVLKPGCIRKFHRQPRMLMMKMENIAFFLTACQTRFSVPQATLFAPTDIHDDTEGANIMKVVRVLLMLAHEFPGSTVVDVDDLNEPKDAIDVDDIPEPTPDSAAEPEPEPEPTPAPVATPTPVTTPSTAAATAAAAAAAAARAAAEAAALQAAALAAQAEAEAAAAAAAEEEARFAYEKELAEIAAAEKAAAEKAAAEKAAAEKAAAEKAAAERAAALKADAERAAAAKVAAEKAAAERAAAATRAAAAAKPTTTPAVTNHDGGDIQSEILKEITSTIHNELTLESKLDLIKELQENIRALNTKLMSASDSELRSLCHTGGFGKTVNEVPAGKPRQWYVDWIIKYGKIEQL